MVLRELPADMLTLLVGAWEAVALSCASVAYIDRLVSTRAFSQCCIEFPYSSGSARIGLNARALALCGPSALHQGCRLATTQVLLVCCNANTASLGCARARLSASLASSLKRLARTSALHACLRHLTQLLNTPLNQHEGTTVLHGPHARALRLASGGRAGRARSRGFALNDGSSRTSARCQRPYATRRSTDRAGAASEQHSAGTRSDE